MKQYLRVLSGIILLLITAAQALLAADCPEYSSLLYIPLAILSVLSGASAKSLMSNLAFFSLLLVFPAFCVMMYCGLFGLDAQHIGHLSFLFSFPLIPILTISTFLLFKKRQNK